MAVQVQIGSVNAYDDIVDVRATLIFSGNYPTGGDTVDFTQAVPSAGFQGLTSVIPSSGPGGSFLVQSQAGNGTYLYVMKKGTAINNHKVQIYSALGTELAAGAYPALVTGDDVVLHANFKKFI